MIRRIILPTILIFLAYGFWVSPSFKEIAAGVSIFLFGMLALEEGFKAFTGGLLERLLRRTTDKVWKSLSFGVVTTTIMQSSSLVSVITISFLSAGLITLAAGIGIIFGANLGTTTGAWLVAGFGLKVKISAYAMPMLVFGVILVFQKSRSLKGIGYVLAGLGFLFLGIHYMKEGFEAYRDTIDLTAFAVPGYPGLFLFTLIGIAATVVMQSSHATLVLIITALAAGQITYDNALALAIGANIGTTITAILGAMSSNVEGKRLAGAHLIFNVVTALIAIAFIYQIAAAVDVVSAWLGIAADDYTLKLAVFHTLFNLIGIVVMLPFINTLVRFLESSLKAKVVVVTEPKYLNDAVIEIPDAAVEAVRKETLRLYGHTANTISRALSLDPNAVIESDDIDALVAKSRKTIDVDIDADYSGDIKVLYSQIVDFISRAQVNMDAELAEELFRLRAAGRDVVEALKGTKHMHKNLTRYMNADNLAVRDEYDKMRVRLAEILKRMNEVRGEDDAAVVLSLDALKVQMDEDDSVANGMLDRLIREDKINGEMATSLMNDSAYAYDISTKLISMGGVLFALGDLAQKEAERSIALDEDEVDKLAALERRIEALEHRTEAAN